MGKGKVDGRKMRSNAFLKELTNIAIKDVKKTGTKRIEMLINGVFK